LVITAPLTRTTQGLFTSRRFAGDEAARTTDQCRSRPPSSNERTAAAFAQRPWAVRRLDVFEQKPLPKDHPLWDQPNVYVLRTWAGDLSAGHARW